MREHLSRFGLDAVGLTGSDREIAAVAKQLGLPMRWSRPTRSKYLSRPQHEAVRYRPERAHSNPVSIRSAC